MKVMLDCVPITVGGGVQVAIALLVGLQRQSEVDWAAVVPSRIRPALPSVLAEDSRITFVNRRTQADRIWLTPYLHSLERKIAPDLVFTVFGPPFFRARAPHLVGFAQPRLIYERDREMPHQTLVGHAGDWLRSVLFRRSDYIVVETEAARMRLAERIGFDPERISVVPNGPNPLVENLSGQPVSLGSRFAILVPSAYYPHKNLEIVPSVAVHMRRLAPGLDFVFRFTLPEDLAEWQAIQAEAAKLRVVNCIETLGTVKITDLARAYGEASAVYLPTLREVSTAVYPESFLFRRPLVTTDLDFARELCGDAAILTPPRDAEKAAASLLAIASSSNLVEKLVKAGERMLASAYPSAAEKFRMQLDLMERVALAGSEEGNRDQLGAGWPAGGAAQASSTAAVRFHDRLASEWDAKYHCGRFQRRAQFFASKILPLIQGKVQWLDAGCGSGYFSRLLAAGGSSVIGVDASEPMVQEAQKGAEEAALGASVRFEVVKSVERLPFADASFDGALCLSVLEYLDRPLDCIGELHRVLKPGGVLVVSLPHRLAPIRLVQRAAVFGPIGWIVPKSWKYASLSRYASTAHGLVEALSAHGFSTRNVIEFDSAMPDVLLKVLPPSLLFVVALRGDKN